jgi:tRNA(Ile)-lysidine synthase
MGLNKSSELALILSELRGFFAKHEAQTYFVAVSGGLDSMLLTTLLLELQLPIVLVHVNYGLRGEESEGDQAFLVQFCSANKLNLHCKKVALKDILTQEKSNLQAKARELRYAYFRELQASTAQSYIVTAQHQSDQIETFWLQLARGAGLKGLAGMSAAQNNLLRPLLKYSREELKALAFELNVTYREDSSNASLKYRRNYWRLELLPFLKASLPSIEQSISLLQNQFNREIDQQDAQLSELALTFKLTKSISLIEIANLTAYQVVELFKINEIPTFVIRRIGELFRAEHGKYLTWQDPISKRHFYFVRQKRDLQLFNDNVQEWDFQMSEIGTAKQEGILIDSSTICGTPFWRTLAPSDKIKVKGMQGSKKVLQILKEAGVPSPIRKRQMVLCDVEKVLAVPGIQVNARILANNATPNKALLCFAKKL